ncbi:MAG TPA: hypothetical protein VF116_08100 [Ktedonobacterales bacterium]
MYDQDRLDQMIRDAKIRQEDKRKAELKEFQAGVQKVLGQELYDLLGVKCMLEKGGGTPYAEFRIGTAQWKVWQNAQPDEGQAEWSLQQPNASSVPVESADDVLIRIDEVDQRDRQRA